MIVYVAGPMTGYVDLNYPAFVAAAVELRSRGFEVLNPVDAEQHNDTGKPQTWQWYMRHALRMVTQADGVALLSGWQASKGATLEVQVATALKLDVRPLSEWLA
jgi:nucleoside 2-deoxyribosyltransferase